MAIDWDIQRDRFDNQATWRRELATCYPGDSDLNLGAAETFDRLAATVKDMTQETRALYDHINSTDEGTLTCSEIEQELMDDIHISAGSAEQFFADVCVRARRKLRGGLERTEH